MRKRRESEVDSSGEAPETKLVSSIVAKSSDERMTCQAFDRSEHTVLAQKAAAGDRGSFERLAWLWWDKIRGFCSAMAAFDRSIAEEASQEVLLRLYRALPRWRGTGPIGAFIYGICKNTTADVLRKHARHSAKHFDVSESAWSAIADSRENPEQAVMRKELSAQIAIAMRSLESQDRALIFLFEVEEASIRELSTLFKIPEGTVKSRLSRIRARLAETLKEAGYGRE